MFIIFMKKEFSFLNNNKKPYFANVIKFRRNRNQNNVKKIISVLDDYSFI